MSLHMLFTILQLLPLRTHSLTQSVEKNVEDGWTFWIYLVSSKGIYSVLVSLILFCCILNAIRARFGNRTSDLNIDINLTKWANKFWNNVSGKRLNCGPLKAYGMSGFGLNSFDLEDDLRDGNILREKVLIAESELDALRNAVDLTCKASSNLEENLHEIESDKYEIEGRSALEKQWINSEIESAREDMDSLQRQLEILRQEKQEVLARCESLQEEAMKASDALKLRQDVQEKLDEALTVVSVLRQAVADLEADRDEAMASLTTRFNMLSDDNQDQQSTENVSPITYAANVYRNAKYSLSKNACVEDIHLLGRGDDIPTSDHHNMMDDDHWINFADPRYEMIVTSTSWNHESEIESNNSSNDCHIRNNDNYNDFKGSIKYTEADQDFDADRMDVNQNIQLTKSTAFIQFLKSNFGHY